MKNLDINIHSDKNDSEIRENKGTGGDQNSSQISNVEFGTLKKIGTNVSQVSTFSNSTVKSNPLVKLFTRNRSQTNVVGRNSEGEVSTILDSKNDFNEIEPPKETKTTKLRAAKKILSPSSKLHFDSAAESSSTDERYSTRRSSEESRGKKQIITSPLSGFHNLFHKSQSAAGLSKFSDRNADDKLFSGSSKTPICLSSNNSNSVVNDTTLARVYKFTSANISTEDNEGFTEHSSLLEIHRKMLTPADLYIQNKFNRHHQHEIGLGIVEKSGNGLSSISSDEEAKLNKSNQQISLLLKPLFIPSKQRNSTSSSPYPFLGHSFDEMGLMIRSHFTAEFNRTANVEQNQKYGKYRLKSNKSSSKGQASSMIGIDNFTITRLDEDDTREFIQDLSAIFVSCLCWLRRDVSKSVQGLDHVNDGRGSNILNMWQTVSESWFYYNRNIRFQILQIFQAMFTGSRSYTEGSFVEQKIPPICIDEMLQQSFCTVFIIPLIEERKRCWTSYQDVINIDSYGLLNDQEKRLFQQNLSLHANALHCFGSLQSLPQSSYFKPDVEVQHLHQTMRAIVANLSDLR